MGALSLDWFEPAMQGAVSIPLALDRVLCIEESKLHFTRCLRAALCNPVPHGQDRIAALAHDIKLLQQTFQHRLGILAIDRPQAWFRHSSTAERGPFAVSVFEEPVFARFDECRAVAVRHLLPELWRNRQVTCSDYDPALSLWGRLLQLNRRLEQINQLPSPFADVRLDELPEAVPDELQSPALHKFGSQIAQRIKTCQRELDHCYEQLWSRSESFLYALHIQYLSNKARQQQKQHQEPKSQSRQGARQQPPPPPRSHVPPIIGEAMRFMEFQQLPNFDDLRQRYRVMAHRLHPDRGGSEDRFKQLTQHYKSLLQHLEES
ncbi:MAG: hypothetical protein M3Q07_20175 [Pseudobdellovibrionaceae bacterium]|uniref:hypothetical protein n=1 Tax=Oligoflexus sp. TaxID=1971216 RepID=UPI0027CDFCAA|nr:hypothetical protein [Oligoflexus sp.]MDQ3234132.1 hypothetical protein [Pseudobdellovibrionaceae bacterium]HYX37774.1 hypothetical protein [Oligoflexus sp.]